MFTPLQDEKRAPLWSGFPSSGPFHEVITPPNGQLSLRLKLARVDWIGNLLIVGSTAPITMGLTSGGSLYPRSSGRVIRTLCVVGLRLVLSIAYGILFARGIGSIH